MSKLPRVCSVDGCERKYESKGFCHKHYEHNRIYGNPGPLKKWTDAVCSVEGCDGKHKSKGYCAKHDARLRTHGSLNVTVIIGDDEARFWSYVQKTDTCWLWVGAVDRLGYGSITVGSKFKLVHRMSYELNVGPIPDRLLVCHSCDVRNCVNPEHLWLGTHSENTRDMISKGRGNFVGPKNPRKGSEVVFSKLDELTVLEIRKLYATGKFGIRELGRAFEVSHSAIGNIVHRLTWKHI